MKTTFASCLPNAANTSLTSKIFCGGRGCQWIFLLGFGLLTTGAGIMYSSETAAESLSEMVYWFTGTGGALSFMSVLIPALGAHNIRKKADEAILPCLTSAKDDAKIPAVKKFRKELLNVHSGTIPFQIGMAVAGLFIVIQVVIAMGFTSACPSQVYMCRDMSIFALTVPIFLTFSGSWCHFAWSTHKMQARRAKLAKPAVMPSFDTEAAMNDSAQQAIEDEITRCKQEASSKHQTKKQIESYCRDAFWGDSIELDALKVTPPFYQIGDWNALSLGEKTRYLKDQVREHELGRKITVPAIKVSEDTNPTSQSIGSAEERPETTSRRLSETRYRKLPALTRLLSLCEA